MRKSNAAAVAARSTAASARDQATVLLVCMALSLSLAMLAARILSVW